MARETLPLDRRPSKIGPARPTPDPPATQRVAVDRALLRGAANVDEQGRSNRVPSFAQLEKDMADSRARRKASKPAPSKKALTQSGRSLSGGGR